MFWPRLSENGCISSIVVARQNALAILTNFLIWYYKPFSSPFQLCKYPILFSYFHSTAAFWFHIVYTNKKRWNIDLNDGADSFDAHRWIVFFLCHQPCLASFFNHTDRDLISWLIWNTNSILLISTWFNLCLRRVNHCHFSTRNILFIKSST